MARWSATTLNTWTPVAVADTTNMTSAGYAAIQGGSSTQYLNILEVFMGGQAASTSSPCIMVLANDSTVGVTLSVGQITPLNAASAALAAPPVSFSTASTEPKRHAANYFLNLSFNAFGGLVRWVYAPGEEIGLLGNTASLGEISLSAFTGGTPGLIGSHMIIEPF
jgi:hypothetical protein